METKQVMAKISGVGQVVLPIDKAMEVIKIIMNGEKYDYDYVTGSDGEKHRLDYLSPEVRCDIEVMAESQYLAYKLNGEGRGLK